MINWRQLQPAGRRPHRHRQRVPTTTTLTKRMLTFRKKRRKRFKTVNLLGRHLPIFDMYDWPAFVIAVALMVPQAFGDDVPGVVSTSSFPSGAKCGRPAVQCLSQASCTRYGHCNCPQGTVGDGQFQCYPSDSSHAQILGEQPTLTTFQNTSGYIYWPCRFRLAEFTTIRQNSSGNCLFQIFASNQIRDRQILLNGFEVHLQITDGSKVVGGIGIRKEGTARNNVFTYTERGRSEFIREDPVTDLDLESSALLDDGSGSGDDGLLDEEEDNDDKYEWGQPEELTLEDGQRVSCQVDEDNFATVNVASCGTAVRFRASHSEASGGSQAGGLSVTVTDKHGPAVLQHPQTYVVGVDPQVARLKGLTLDQEILHRSMEYAARQYSSPSGTECADTARVYRAYCQTDRQKVTALKDCSFFLENPDLVHCMDASSEPGSSNSLVAFKRCVWNSCRPSAALCTILRSDVWSLGCSSKTPASFSQLSCGTTRATVVGKSLFR